MSKFFKVDYCNDCPYIEQMWTGEYLKTERVYYCANSDSHFLILNKDRFKEHPLCEADDFDVIMRAYA